MLPSYYRSQTQIARWNRGTGKCVVSAETCRDSGQPQVMGLLHEWCVACSWMSKSCICCRFGLNNAHNFLVLCHSHTKVWLTWPDVYNSRVNFRVCAEIWNGGLHIHVVSSQLQAVNGVQQECVVGARPQPTKHRGFETQHMFSHRCINYGWNTDGVLLVHARPTFYSLFAISRENFSLDRKGVYYISVE